MSLKEKVKEKRSLFIKLKVGNSDKKKKKLNTKLVLKRTMAGALAAVSIISAVNICNTETLAAASGTATGSLGTASAMNSPVLNSNFSADNWSKWEMEVWGIFLSNFVSPFLDNYESAFSTSSGSGSKGAGLENLQFGSGNDPSTNSVLAWLTTQAIQYQTTYCQDIYVCYTASDGSITGPMDRTEATDSNTRPAKFQDLFFQTGKDSSNDWNTNAANAQTLYNYGKKVAGNSWTTNGITDSKPSVLYDKDELDAAGGGSINPGYVQYIGKSASIPTFYIKSTDGKYITILDYTNAVDVQMFAAVFNKMLTSGQSSEIGAAFDKLWDANNTLRIDSFGNIIDSKSSKMCFAASCNQHLSKTPTVNLLNSWIFSGYNSTDSSDSLVQSTRSFDVNNNKGSYGSSTYHGLSALDGDNRDNQNTLTLQNGQVLLYFDTDVIAMNLKKDAPKNSNDCSYTEDLQGKLLTNLADQTLKNHSFNLKIAAHNEDIIAPGKKTSDKVENVAFSTNTAASMIANAFDNIDASMLMNLELPDGSSLPMFEENDAVMIPVDAPATDKTKKSGDKGAQVYRQAINYMFQGYRGASKEINDLYSSSDIKAKWSGCINATALQTEAINFMTKMNTKNSSYKTFKSASNSYNDVYSGTSARFIVAYPLNNTLLSVSKYFGRLDGCDMCLYSTYIYSTYLQFYGVHSDKVTNGNDESNLNTDIFTNANSVLNIDINECKGIKSEEQLEKENRELVNKMLTIDGSGDSYRTTWLNNIIAKICYSWYRGMVYGKSNNSYTTVASSSNDGFLSTPSYSENILTGWLFNVYEEVAIWLLLAAFIFIIITLVINRKKVSWLLINTTLAFTLILLVPSIGELVPFISNKFVENMYQSNFTYWSIEEQINYQNTLEQSYQESGLSTEDASTAAYLITNLAQNYGDSTLMIKRDISGKVMQKLSESYSEQLQLTSARWMLPTLIQQISARDKADENNYVYSTEVNFFNSCYSLYLQYNPTYKTRQATALSNTAPDTSASYISLGDAEKESIYNEYNATSISDRAYEMDGGDSLFTRSFSYSLKSAGSSTDKLVHTQFYLLRSSDNTDTTKYQGLLSSGITLDSSKNRKKAYAEYLDSNLSDTSNQSKWDKALTDMGDNADNWDTQDVKTVNREYGYLWATESPLYYFYMSTQDLFPSDVTKSNIITQLEGKYNSVYKDDGTLNDKEVYSLDGNSKKDEIRHAPLMYATVNSTTTDEESGLSTGYTRDIVDLEEMFKNMIPYLYKMTIVSGGDDNTGGKLTGQTIKNNNYYEDSDGSWLFRSNWAIKMVENPTYSRSCTVKDKDGNKYSITNPMNYDCYPDNRPMVFSEAQQKAMGLSDGDLSIVELKCVQINRDIAKKWTLMMNYASTANLTSEVMIRQMALDATMIFCKAFTPTGLTSGTYALYPTSIDLRHLSFDALMKIIVTNTYNANITGSANTMQAVLDDGQLLNGILLLIVTFLYAVAIPFIKQCIMCFLLVLILWALIKTVKAEKSTKFKLVGGTTITNMVYLIMNMFLYGAVALLIKITTTDEVLTMSRMKMSTGSFIATMLLMVVVAVIYVFVCYKFVRATWENRHDLGFSMYAQMSGAIGAKITNSVGRVGKTLSGFNKNGGATGKIETPKKKDEVKKKNGKTTEESYTDKQIAWATDKLSSSSSGGDSNSSSSSNRAANDIEAAENSRANDSMKNFVKNEMEKGEKNQKEAQEKKAEASQKTETTQKVEKSETKTTETTEES